MIKMRVKMSKGIELNNTDKLLHQTKLLDQSKIIKT